MPVASRSTRRKKNSVKKSSSVKPKGTRQSKSSRSKQSIDDVIQFAGEGELVGGSEKITDHIMVVYGESAIGKTSTCHNIPNSYIIQCDVKRKGLLGRQSFIPSQSLDELREENPKYTPWDIAVATIKKAAEDPTVETVIVDNFGELYKHALNNKCFRMRIKDPSDENDYGATWREIEDSLTSAMNAILENDKGCVIICHSKSIEIELPGGDKYDRIQPEVMNAPFKWLKACTDYAFYLCYGEDGDRVWNLRGDKEIWLKCCVDFDNAPHFIDPDGNPVNQISAGSSAKEAWNNLVDSWNNKVYDIDWVDPKKKSKFKKRGRSSRKRISE